MKMKHVEKPHLEHRCRSGVFGLSDWTPCRTPKKWQTCTTNESSKISAASPMEASGAIGKNATVKFNYKANLSSPLGVELNLSRSEEVFIIRRHPEEDMWLFARNRSGQEGYIPANYIEQSGPVSSLPWLDKPQTACKVDTSGPIKRYKSSYTHEGLPDAKPSDEFYCKLCEKRLNGPAPYNAHMSSRAHKEEVERAIEYGEYVP